MRNLFWGILLIIIGVLFLLDNLEIADFGDLISTYWPLIFVLWGIHILFRKRSYGEISITTESTETDSDLLHRSNVFGDLSIMNTSQNFKGGSISTVFGDCNLDLDKAVIAEGEHNIRLSSVFGDILIHLPKNCAVSVSASSVLGDMLIFGEKRDGIFKDIKITTPGYEAASRKLKLQLSIVFGDLKIIQ